MRRGYAATMRNHKGLFTLLDRYLDALDLNHLARIVFGGDGAPWIWSGVEALCQRRGLDEARVDQVIDYTHAKQNLQELIDLLPRRLQHEGRLANRPPRIKVPQSGNAPSARDDSFVSAHLFESA